MPEEKAETIEPVELENVEEIPEEANSTTEENPLLNEDPKILLENAIIEGNLDENEKLDMMLCNLLKII